MHPWTAPLLESFRQRVDSLPHALLVHGPQGIGKLALAEHMAQFILCESADPKKRPCGGCEGCRWFVAGSHPDFRRVEPEALAPQREADPDDAPAEPAAKKGKPSLEIKIDQVRGLADFLNVGSHRGRRRVALVHPAEDMNLNAANATAERSRRAAGRRNVHPGFAPSSAAPADHPQPLCRHSGRGPGAGRRAGLAQG